MGSQQADNGNLPDANLAQAKPGADPCAACSAEGGGVAEDRWLLDQLIETHHAALYRYAYRLSGSSADAEDLVQQVFMIACRKLDQVRDPQHVAGWLFAVLRSCFLKSCRKPHPVAAGNLELNLDAVPGHVPPPREFDSAELQHALDQLPAEFKIVVTMFYFEHSSYKQIAEQLDLPIGTVMSRLARAKQRLRALLVGQEASEMELALRPDRRTVMFTQPTTAEPGR